VLPIIQPNVYLVQVYEMIQNIALAIPISIFQSWKWFQGSRICFPTRFELDPTIDNIYVKLEEIRQLYTNTNDSENSLHYSIGWMVRNLENGDRCSIRNPRYEFLKKIRGNHSNMQYQFLCLQKENKVVEFIHYFPNYTHLFNYFNKLYWDFVQDVHREYIEKYVKKTGGLYSKKYSIILYKLHHEIYLPSLNQVSENGISIAPTIINKMVVHSYMMNMNISELFYYMNYDEIHNKIS
jgi:hypothetical protein